MKKHAVLIEILLTLSIWAILVTSASAAAQFKITNLGDLNPTSINSLGQISGNIGSTDGNHSYVWSFGKLIPLPLLTDNPNSAFGINDAGHIVGDFYASPFGGIRAYQYTTKITDLGSLGGSTSSAFAINNRDQITGYSFRADNSAHAFLWDAGNIQDLGAALGATFSVGSSINLAGTVVGYSYNPGQYLHATIFSSKADPIDVGSVLGSTYSVATGINDFGQVVGYWSADFTPCSLTCHAFLLDAGGVRDLGNLGSNISLALGVNNIGQVVGFSNSASGTSAFLYQSSAMLDLNALVAVDSGWSLTMATAINDYGQIVGSGSYKGVPQGYLLTPVPEPAILNLFTCGSLLLAALMFNKTGRYSLTSTYPTSHK